MPEDFDIVIVGAGAAGLMTAIWAGRTAGGRARILLLDGARTIGAKILVAGGGRCNVTHEYMDERAFAGSTPGGIRKVLRRFDHERTVAFFADLGVALKREDTGKLFPVTDRARTVLDALLAACRASGAELRHPWRVDRIDPLEEGGFEVTAIDGQRVRAPSVILATGGKSLPKSGSDGHGFTIARALGHTVTPRVFPALVPLLLPDGHFLRALSGIALPVRLDVRQGTGKTIRSFDNAMLLTHFGLSGPAALDASRYLLDACAHDPAAALVVNWCPGLDFAAAESTLLEPGRDGLANVLARRLPRRLAEALCVHVGAEPSAPRGAMSRDVRRALAHALVEMPLPITGDRGFTFAEVTAGGIPLSETQLDTMASRLREGLFLVGELLDVDGRIGGFNFQWAWATGFIAGTAAGHAAAAARRGAAQ